MYQGQSDLSQGFSVNRFRKFGKTGFDLEIFARYGQSVEFTNFR